MTIGSDRLQALGIGELDIELLSRYWLGTATDLEIARAEAWFDEKPERRVWYGQLRKGIEGGAKDDLPAAEIARRTSAVLHAIDQEEASGGQPYIHRRIPRVAGSGRHPFVAGIVGTASVLAVAIGAFFFSRSGSTSTNPQPSAHSYTTSAGQHGRVTLPDGSTAVLGPATTLDVVTDDASGAITTTVSGQVLFTVAHRSDLPFVVHTSRSITRVLGTTFLVRQYNADAVARIVVAEGRVAIRGTDASQSPAVLGAYAMGTVNDSGQVAVTSAVNANDYVSWANGTLVFEDTPVGELVAELSRAYGKPIRLADSVLARRPITWEIQTSQYPLAQALHELTLILNAHVIESKDSVVIVAGRKASQRSLPVRSTSPSRLRYGK